MLGAPKSRCIQQWKSSTGRSLWTSAYRLYWAAFTQVKGSVSQGFWHSVFLWIESLLQNVEMVNIVFSSWFWICVDVQTPQHVGLLGLMIPILLYLNTLQLWWMYSLFKNNFNLIAFIRVTRRACCGLIDLPTTESVSAIYCSSQSRDYALQSLTPHCTVLQTMETDWISLQSI